MEEDRLIRLLWHYGFLKTASLVCEGIPGRRDVLYGRLVRPEDKGRWGFSSSGNIVLVTVTGDVFAHLPVSPLSEADQRGMRELIAATFYEVPGGARRIPPDGPWAV